MWKCRLSCLISRSLAPVTWSHVTRDPSSHVITCHVSSLGSWRHMWSYSIMNQLITYHSSHSVSSPSHNITRCHLTSHVLVTMVTPPVCARVCSPGIWDALVSGQAQPLTCYTRPPSHRANNSEPTLVTTPHHLNTNPRQVENSDSVSIQMQIVKSSLESVFARMFVYSERCEFLQARVCLLSEASQPLNWDYQWLMGLDSNPIATPATACTANIH